jgi:hypothetical protein
LRGAKVWTDHHGAISNFHPWLLRLRPLKISTLKAMAANAGKAYTANADQFD